jgi:hypothetical protein
MTTIKREQTKYIISERCYLSAVWCILHYFSFGHLSGTQGIWKPTGNQVKQSKTVAANFREENSDTSYQTWRPRH